MLTASSSSISSSSSDDTHTIGTLKYDRRGIFVLFGWLLWGDFAFNFFESIFGRFMPIYLKQLDASNVMIGITTGSIAGLVNVFFLPNISQWSDRLRTRYGRRIPLLIVVAPLTTFSLVSIGFAPEISAWLHAHVTSGFAPALTSGTLLLSLICVLTVSFHFFNMVLVNAYNWLLRDVVPQALMARFLSMFRVVGTVAGGLFLYFVFPTMMTHRKETFFFLGLFYLVAFMFMCFKVKEGEYPEPLPHAEGSNLFVRFGTYFRDCLALPIYRNYFLVYVLVVLASGCAGSFTTLYAKHTLAVADTNLGHFWAYSMALGAVVYIPVGWLCDRFNAMRIAIAGLLLSLTAAVLTYFFMVDQRSWMICTIIFTIPGVTWGLSSMAVMMHLFPDKAFGQFSAGLNVFACGALIPGNYLCGVFMDLVDSNYRLVYWWTAVFYIAALFPMFAVYRDWKKFGGPKNYVAPIPPSML